MAAFQNHRIFTIRCLKEDLIPVSIKLRSNIKTPRAKIIIKKTERALLNERIRNINNTVVISGTVHRLLLKMSSTTTYVLFQRSQLYFN